jgi:hypothetical protein
MLTYSALFASAELTLLHVIAMTNLDQHVGANAWKDTGRKGKVVDGAKAGIEVLTGILLCNY